MTENLIAQWGYVAVLAGTLFEGETTLLAAGAMAHRGLLSLPLVLAVAFFGGVAGDQVWFHVGRRLGPPLIDQRPQWQRRLACVDAYLLRYGSLFVMLFRFLPLPLVRTVTPALLGARGYPPLRFAVLNVLGGALWTVTITAAGFGLGAAMTRLFGRTIGPHHLLLAVVAAVLLGWLVVHRLWRDRGVR